MHNHHRTSWVALGAALTTLLLALACALGGVAVQRGIVPPPQVELRLGAVRFMARQTSVSDCPPHRTNLCAPELTAISRRHIFVVRLTLGSPVAGYSRDDDLFFFVMPMLH